MNDISNNKLNCPNCGEEVKSTDKFCSSCGVSINVNEKKNTEKNSLNKNELQRKNRGNKSGDNNKKIKVSDTKNISIVKIIYILAALLVITFIVIYSAGVFDKPVASAINNTNDVHKGVDLQHLQEINSLEEAVKNNPNNKTSLLELAHLLNDSGFKDRAIEKYKIYLTLDSKNADVLVDMGVCYYELGKYDDAIKQMKEALKYQPKHQIAHLNLGIVNLTAGSHDEAISWWKKTVEINPSTDIAKRAQEFINSH